MKRGVLPGLIGGAAGAAFTVLVFSLPALGVGRWASPLTWVFEPVTMVADRLQTSDSLAGGARYLLAVLVWNVLIGVAVAALVRKVSQSREVGGR